MRAVFLVFLFAFCGCNMKQNSNKIELYKAWISVHKSLSYTAAIKSWSSVNNDTLLRKEQVVISRVPGDTLIGGKVFIKDDYGEAYYDGNNVYYHDKDSSIVQKFLLSEGGIYRILGNISSKSILSDLMDTTSWVFSKNYSSKYVTQNDTAIVSYFMNDSANGEKTQFVYMFGKTDSMPFKICRYKTMQGVNSGFELTFSDTKYVKGIDDYQDKIMNNKYKYVIKHPAEPVLPVPAGTKAAWIEGKNIMTSETINPGDLDGKVVLIDFWFVGCQPCMSSFPHLTNLRTKYSSAKVAIIGIDANDTDEKGMKEFAEKRNLNYAIVHSPPDILQKFRITIFPTIYILDKHGVVVSSEVGFEEKDFEKRISEVIDRYQ